jgi:uncharacterized protein YqjF (DUF2071 family)
MRTIWGLGTCADAAERFVLRLAPGGEAAAQSRGLAQQAHRPWPMPRRRWLQGQTWRDLLFAHWPVPPEVLRGVVPPALPIDIWEGEAWIAVAPFEVTGWRLRGTLPVPLLSHFAETNVRTYTTVDGRPGVYFLSLDAASALAVAGARATYRLPYFRARMAIERSGGQVRYRSARVGAAASLRIVYQPAGAVFQARPGTLEHFLIERYCLYTVDGERVRRTDIHHPPWDLQAAQAEFAVNTMTTAAGVALPSREPLLHYARRQDVVIWSPRAASTAAWPFPRPGRC